MKKFGYLRDPLFLICSLLYAANRWIIEPRVRSPFMHDHFNDLLLMPCALPLLIWMHRRLKLRTDDRSPTAGEIALYCAVWSVQCEVLGPHILKRSVGDPWDVAAYACGGILAGLWWHRHALRQLWLAHEL